jgi:hypothetical protein
MVLGNQLGLGRSQRKKGYMSSFSDFKKRSKNSVEDLSKKLESLNSKESYKDDRFWKPGLDSSKNGYAVIRFLPPVEGEDVPFVKLYSHAFQGKGGWFIENCRTTLGEKCPICEANTELWNSGLEEDKDIARKRKRKLNYISNILVISDPANSENEGKVFLFKYGTKIFEKVQALMSPEFKDETPIDPFNFWEGADFKLKIRNVGGYVNYDRSEFAAPAPLMGGDDKKLETLWKKQYSLKEFVVTSNFKSYEELKERFKKTVGEDIREQFDESSAKTVEDDSTVEQVPSEDMDTLDYFKSLKNKQD